MLGSAKIGSSLLYLFALVVALAATNHSKDSGRRPSGGSPGTSNDPAQLLTESINFFNNQLRDRATGQYYDAVTLSPKPSPEDNSSAAATGMGLVTLAIADATDQPLNAHDLAVQSLRTLLGETGTFKFVTSKYGWLRHWFYAQTGEDNQASRDDGYSTIDTSILAAGAQLTANYFEAVGKDPGGTIRKAADKILLSVDWASAIADMDGGRLYLHFDTKTDTALPTATSVFNESLLIVCMGKLAEGRRHQPGRMTEFWKKHYQDPNKLPRSHFGNVDLLTDNPGHFVSSFALQFSSYLCADVGNSPQYMQYLKNAQVADQDFSSKARAQAHMWGMGGGEVRSKDAKTGKIKQDYHADAINDDPFAVVSPHIIAGFLAVNPKGIEDLKWMRENKKCIYQTNSGDVLWRCIPQHPDILIDRLQAVDFSTTVMGLATLNPKIGGFAWFQKYAGGLGR